MSIIPTQVSTADWPLFPRKVKFEWSTSPLHWIPQSPFASHTVNQFGFSLVRGEYFFCRTFNKALPYIRDEKLRKDVETFIRQEAIHAQAHKESIEQYLQQYGVDIQDQYAKAQYLFDHILGDKPFGVALPKFLEKQWLFARVGIVAAAEHYTCAIGQYVLDHTHWQERGADPVVSDLFTWHCAEEVEHRTVAYDLYQHLSGNYLMRAGIMMGVLPILTYIVAAGTAKLASTDRTIPKSKTRLTNWRFWKEWQKAHQQHLAPGPIWFLTTGIRFFKPSYHPYHEGSTEQAVAYINQSPAVLAYKQINDVNKPVMMS